MIIQDEAMFTCGLRSDHILRNRIHHNIISIQHQIIEIDILSVYQDVMYFRMGDAQ